MARKKKNAEQPQHFSRLRQAAAGRASWVLGIVGLLVLLFAGERIYRGLREDLAAQSRFRLAVDSIAINTPPAWIRCDIRREVFRNADLLSDVSLLTDTAKIHARLVDAFELHPWVERVERIELVPPAAARVELAYRRPVAAVEVNLGGVADLLPVDAAGVRLPDGDLTDAERRYLPRIADARGQVLVGEPWTDPRILGGVRLAVALAGVWEQLSLVDIVPGTYAEYRHPLKYFTYELRASYGTRINWGAAPGMGPAEEDTVETKLARLTQCIAEHGPLNSSYAPQAIDIRDRLVVEQRTAKSDKTDESVTR